MATPDDSVENLERFISVLTVTIEEVHEHSSTIEDHADTIEDLDSDTESALEDLSTALADFEDDLTGAEQDALEQVQALRQEARDGTDQRLTRAESEVERAESDFESVLEDGRSRIEEAHSELTSDGFSGLEATMQNVESALAEDQQQAVASFDGLDAGVAELETRTTGAYTDTTGEFDQTNAEVANQQTAIETDAGDGITALDGVGDDIDGFCRAEAAALVGLYDGWGGEVDTEAQELMDEAATALIEASVAVDTLIQDDLTDPVQAVLTDAFGPYLTELGELQSVVDEAQGPATGELMTLVDDLEKALGVMDTIAELLRALE